MKFTLVAILSLASSVLAASVGQRSQASKRQGPIITAPLIDADLNDAATQSKPYAQAIAAAAKAAQSEAELQLAVDVALPQITQVFNNLASKLGQVATGNKPDATEVQDGYQAFLQVFAQADLAIYNSKFESTLVRNVSNLLVAYCNATKAVLLELQRLLTGADLLGNRIAGGLDLTTAILDALDLTCLNGILVPCAYGPPRVGIPQCPCPPGQICPL